MQQNYSDYITRSWHRQYAHFQYKSFATINRTVRIHAHIKQLHKYYLYHIYCKLKLCNYNLNDCMCAASTWPICLSQTTKTTRHYSTEIMLLHRKRLTCKSVAIYHLNLHCNCCKTGNKSSTVFKFKLNILKSLKLKQHTVR